MKHASRFKAAMAGIVAVGILALGATAQAVPYDPNQAFGAGYGDAANPAVITINQTGGFFQDTINFDLGAFTHFNMTSTTTGLSQWFGASIFENVNDSQVPGGGAATSFTSFALADLGIAMPTGDYHLHPAGVGGSGGSYTLTMWGSTAAPVPARESGAVTQMGIQNHSNANYDAALQLFRAGHIGKVRAIHLSEQGPNSPDYSEKSLKEQAAAMAYVWKKIARLDLIGAPHLERLLEP